MNSYWVILPMFSWNSEEPIFPVKIFLKPNRDCDSVKNFESHDMKFLTSEFNLPMLNHCRFIPPRRPNKAQKDPPRIMYVLYTA